VRFYGLLLGSLSVFWLTSPAEAGKLLSWQFEPSENRLVLNTEEKIQPKAQLISNPSRVVIDLPGTTLARSSVKQTVGGYISNIRVGQFDAQTTRLVIELVPEYTLDPQQIKIKALSST
jgi:N-acetylmuramoyl-L-alanine amidase